MDRGDDDSTITLSPFPQVGSGLLVVAVHIFL